ncbi:Methylated-DNA--protein-cysteine methyltransferase [Apodemus speciosus]|uniref:Methylated-DNA--protein-cysteine methyltransferase n=1 Tax=Apodemus speciosus TaxID=105296 RepID=A0ABQ0F0L1_APOSI
MELGRMAETCKMKYTVLDSPLGKMELSGCERGLHGIRFLSRKTPSTNPTEHSFTRQVLWKLLKVVKFGEMVSYQQLAALAGNPKVLLRSRRSNEKQSE